MVEGQHSCRINWQRREKRRRALLGSGHRAQLGSPRDIPFTAAPTVRQALAEDSRFVSNLKDVTCRLQPEREPGRFRLRRYRYRRLRGRLPLLGLRHRPAIQGESLPKRESCQLDTVA